jgi:hypothetical protein
MGIISGQTFGCGGFEEIVVGRDEDQGRQTVGDQGAVEAQGAGQMNGIVAAQTMSGGQIYGFV